MYSSYTLPIGNFIFSFLIAFFIGRKKHIGAKYVFLFGIGFTFVTGLIVALLATPSTQPLKKVKPDIYAYLILFLFLAGTVFTSKIAYDKLIQNDKLAIKERVEKSNSYGNDSFILASYEKDKNMVSLINYILLLIGSLSGTNYFLNKILKKDEH